MKMANLDEDSDIDTIMAVLAMHRNPSKRYQEPFFDFEQAISSYQINAFMKSQRYTKEVKNGYNIWTTKFEEIIKDGKKKLVPTIEAEKEFKRKCK
jgi:hypothetical protein